MHTRRLLVLGEPRNRDAFAEQLAAVPGTEIAECDPALGDCVMFVRLEAARYDGFFFLCFDHPVTRGALPIVADRAVLVPLLEEASAAPDPVHDGYLFRLPKAIGFGDEQERATILAVVPKAAAVSAEFVGRGDLDAAALACLVEHATNERWQWDDLVHDVERSAADGRGHEGDPGG